MNLSIHNPQNLCLQYGANALYLSLSGVEQQVSEGTHDVHVTDGRGLEVLVKDARLVLQNDHLTLFHKGYQK